MGWVSGKLASRGQVAHPFSPQGMREATLVFGKTKGVDEFDGPAIGEQKPALKYLGSLPSLAGRVSMPRALSVSPLHSVLRTKGVGAGVTHRHVGVLRQT